MSVTRPTYPTKTNNPSDPENVRKFQHGDANELKAVAENHADHLESLLAALGISGGSGSIGSFISLAVLQAAYPDGAGDSYAIIDDLQGGAPNVATYNDTSGLWELAVPDQSVIWVANVASLPGTGIGNKLYVTLDAGSLHYWHNSQWNQAGGSSGDVVVKYVENNGAHYRTIKGHGNSGPGFQVGDEIVYRDPVTRKRYVNYVLNASLTLPADFTDRNKIDQYPPVSPLL